MSTNFLLLVGGGVTLGYMFYLYFMNEWKTLIFLYVIS